MVVVSKRGKAPPVCRPKREMANIVPSGGSSPSGYTKNERTMNDRMKLFYMDLAKRSAQMSRAIRLQVGSIVVKNDNILAFSWNGTPTRWDNNCEDRVYMNHDAGGWLSFDEIKESWPYEEAEIDPQLGYRQRYALKTKPEVLHAEMNCLMKLARGSESGESASMFITHAPCIECAKGIYQAGIKAVYYENEYRSTDGLAFLKKSSILIEKLNLK